MSVMNTAALSAVPPSPAPLAPPAELPVLRLLPVPPCDPPYDDELPGWRPDLVAAPALRAPAPLRLVPPVPRDDEDDEPVRTPIADLPAARPFAHALVQRALEVLAGLRPVSQLQRDTTLELYDEIDRLVRSRPRPSGVRPTRAAVRSVHVQERPEGVAEVCATVVGDGRARALALRLEGIGGRWRCTELVGL